MASSTSFDMTQMDSTLDEITPVYRGGSLIVSVEGNIGSGKSTFLEYCSRDQAFEVYPEPIEKWTNVGGVNLLERYYSDPAKWGFTFQMEVLVTTLESYLSISPRPIKLIERSLLSARHCFQRSMSAHGLLDPVSEAVLEGFHKTTGEQWRATPQVIVYLATSPEVAYHRLKTRARSEENNVTLGYLTEIGQFHDDWLSGLHAQNLAEEMDIPVLWVNADLPLDTLVRDYDRCIKELKTLYDM